MEKPLFLEEQQVGQRRMLKTILITTLFGTGILGFWFIRLGYSRKRVTGEVFSDPAFMVVVLLFLAILTMVIVINSVSRLQTKIDKDGIYVRYFPYKKRWEKISVSGIHSYRLRKYRPYREYGGYGIKDRRRKGKAYIISGRTGLQLHLKNGKKILIGTQKKQAIIYAMDKVMKGKKTA
ncbi:hypothetical protein D1614_20755 [Maribellus luteus]|uniref:Bacterial Pleckstrin homology domain-containing protein n=1 Tax=Maribellus luteus TaxID=2305463 RepID=A0A399SVE1_9BACT|nr:hypothetical protein [Maribellus luteus]RIJ45953.1 hypothetical protein D1614_20755 [Maribellus luteus]